LHGYRVLSNGRFGSRRGLSPFHRAGEELEEAVEYRPLVGAQLTIDAGNHLCGAGAWLVPRRTGLGGAAAQPADQLTQPFGSSRPLLAARLEGAGVRQLFRNFWEVDLEVMNKDIVHGVISRRLPEYRMSGKKSCQGQFGGCSFRAFPCTKMLREPKL
jgi:hypothetical protein